MSTKRHKSLARVPLALAVMTSLYGPYLFAQQAQPEEETNEEATQEGEQPKQLERVTVTGSLISRLGFDSISPVQIITADTSATLGQLDTASILQTSNVAAGSTQISNQFSGFVVEGGNGVQTLSLRGLGANRTLVLLDGRRPGPAGTRGQVGAFDLNVIPSVILQRIELLKDGGGSVYGSDAVAGVVNLITRKSVDRPTLSVLTNLPFESGGSNYQIAGATGWDFDNGSVVAAFQYFDSEPLLREDRDYFACPRDLVRNANGDLIDRVDRSVIGNTSLGGCNNLYANTVIDTRTGLRYIPSPNGVTIGPIPGYRPRTNAPATGGNPAFYEDVLNYDFMGSAHIFSDQDRTSLFSSADFTFGDVNWTGQVLYTNRETKSRQFRQFFPAIDGRPFGFGTTSTTPYIIQPIMPFKSDANIDVDYWYFSSTFSGGFGSDSSWGWRADTTYSRSSGDYTVLAINRDLTGDVQLDRNGGGVPINYLSPALLSGAGMQGLIDRIGQSHTGNTVYTQLVANATINGDLFETPAGMAGAAFGTEFRRISIDDTPSEFEQGGFAWGQSGAQPTRGKDYVSEIFGEVEVPVLAGLPLVEQLTFNGSARMFKYDTVADSDYVWKVGMGWQIIPSLRLRATNGTSYRAPGLYELYLGNLTSFVGQLGIDPCIDWGNSNNPNIRTNCAAAGVPANYTGAGSSATVVTGGGLGVVKPETSKSFTTGLVFTPEFANISASLDYFEIEVRDEIATLSGNAIVGSCYALPVFPNDFCNLFTRNPGNAAVNPYNITEVRASFLNINRQKVRGYDLNVRWDGDFSFGKIEVESQFTYTMEDVRLLFSNSQASGFNSDDRNGEISRPKLVGDIRTSLERGDLTYTWGVRYVDSTDNLGVGGFVTPAAYFGNPNPVYDSKAESAVYHTASVLYRQADWDLLVGVENVFDKEPPTVSAGTATVFGNVPAFATQYDWLGRSLFARFNYRF
ncbi:MAG: TonB-dependent receptor domain-containing protein [Silanimonas sp.]